MTLPFVAVVIVHWKDIEATRACLRSLKATRYANLSIILVDNGSGNQISALGLEPGDCTLLSNPTNLGFTGGVNTGIKFAVAKDFDYVWLLNTDATVGPDVLGRLVDIAERDSRIGLVSPIFHNPDHPDQAEFRLARFDTRSRTTAQTADPIVAEDWRAHYDTTLIAIGTALLIRRAVLDAIGVLDDQFYAYVEDVDYSLRAAAAGFRVVTAPDIVVYHAFKRPIDDPGGVPPYLHYLITRNYPLLWRKLAGSSRIPSFSLVAHSRDSPPLRRTIPSSSTGRDPWPRRTAPALG